MKELRRIIATCRDFRKVVVVRFFRTTTNISQCLINSVIRNFRTTELHFAALKNKIENHFRDLTKMIKLDRLSLTTNHF